MEKEKEFHQFGYCYFCGSPLSWESDSDMGDRIDDPIWDGVPVAYLHCGNCGADYEITGCNNESKRDYSYWNEE